MIVVHSPCLCRVTEMIAIILVATFVVMVPNISAGNSLEKNANNFGPYTLSWSTFELCKGPKAKNLSEIVADVQNQGGDYYGRMNLTFFVPSRIDEIKIVVSTIKDNVKSVLWAYNLKDPCQHFLFASIIEKHLNAHNCAVEKGNYFAEVNFSELTKSFLGSSFFYGDYIMKATALTKKGNILCISTNMAVEKKGKEAA